MLYKHQGYLMQGLQRLYLFIAIKLLRVSDLLHDPPLIPHCHIATIEDGLIADTSYEPVFKDIYEFYAHKLVTFTNFEGMLLLQLSVLIKLKLQVPMSLYSIDTVPVPMDAETYEGKNNEYSLIEVEYKYMAVTHITCVPLTEQQLQLCTKWGPIYYCESAHLLRDKNVPSCASAIYYDAEPAVKIKHCKSKYIKSNHLEPKILDGGQNLILSNLLKPWTLVCLKYFTL